MRGEVKNAGGSYFLDNPSNFGPFKVEKQVEKLLLSLHLGKKLVNEMGAHMTDALQTPFNLLLVVLLQQ